MEVRPYGQFSASVTNLRQAGATVFSPRFVNKPANPCIDNRRFAIPAIVGQISTFQFNYAFALQ
jgi:hypothetical protein